MLTLKTLRIMKETIQTLCITMFAIYAENFSFIVQLIGLVVCSIMLVGAIKSLRQRKR